jgi:hypothetical protein
MEYKWEKIAAQGIMPHIIDLNDETMSKFEIIGVAVANTHTAEACFLPVMQPDGSSYAADCYEDVRSDVERIYNNSVDMMFKDKK